MARGKLDEAQQRAVVQWLAQGSTPSRAAELVSLHFKIKITRQSIEQYDPTTVAGAGLGEELRAVFFTTRDAYFKDVAGIPVASQAVRLRRLERLYEVDESRGNTAAAASHLEQAARELGSMYTNTRVHELAAREGEGAPVLNVFLHGMPKPAAEPADHADGSAPSPEAE